MKKAKTIVAKKLSYCIKNQRLCQKNQRLCIMHLQIKKKIYANSCPDNTTVYTGRIRTMFKWTHWFLGWFK